MIETTGFSDDLEPKIESFIKDELDAKRVKIRSISNHNYSFNADGVRGEVWLNCLSNDEEIRNNDILYDVELLID